MSEVPYEPPRITDLSPKQVLNSSDTAISREGLRAQAKKTASQAQDRVVLGSNVKAIETLQQMFPGSVNTEKIDRLRPEDEDFSSILNPN